jgi:hypothetical protein
MKVSPAPSGDGVSEGRRNEQRVSGGVKLADPGGAASIERFDRGQRARTGIGGDENIALRVHAKAGEKGGEVEADGEIDGGVTPWRS